MLVSPFKNTNSTEAPHECLGRAALLQNTRPPSRGAQREAAPQTSPEQQQHRLRKGLEVVIPVDLVVVSHSNLPKHLVKTH